MFDKGPKKKNTGPYWILIGLTIIYGFKGYFLTTKVELYFYSI